MFKTTDTKTSARTASKNKGQPFFSKETRPPFFSNENETATTQPFFVQAKLNVGKPNDHFEREADAVADKVVQQKISSEIVQAKPIITPAITPITQLKCDTCINEEKSKKEKEDEPEKSEEKIQKKPIFESDGTDDDDHSIQKKCADCEKEEKLTQEKKEEIEKPEEKVQMKPIFESGGTDEDDHNIQRKCAECEKEEELQKKEEGDVETVNNVQLKAIFESNEEIPVQRKENNDPPASSSNLETKLTGSKGSGDSLPSATRSLMEGSIGADFSRVKIHTDSRAAEMSKNLGAQAFTHGNDIYFGSGKYDTSSTAGKHLLAHELTHTVQQGGVSRGIQKKPGDTDPPADAPKKTIAEVTTGNPTPKGEIKEENGGIVILINGLRVKANSDKTIIANFTKPHTLPKPGSRKEDKTNQLGIWKKEARAGVTKSLETLLDNINKSQTLEDKKKSNNRYSLKLIKSTGGSALTGTFSELVNACLVPKWNSEGKLTAFQVEHILDYQIAGIDADKIGNLMLLNASINNTLGQVVKEYIKGDIEGILSHYNKFVEPGKLVTNGEAARAAYTIKANTFGNVVTDMHVANTIFLDFINGLLRNPYDPTLVKLESLAVPPGSFILKSGKKNAGIILPYSRAKFQVGSYEMTTDGDATAGTITSIKVREMINGSAVQDPAKEKTYTLKPVSGEAHTYKADDFGYYFSQIKLKYLSLVEFAEPELDEGLNITVYGTIKAPSPKFLNSTPIEVSVVGRELTIQKTFSADDLAKKVGPITIDFASLTISLSTAKGFGASGVIGFSIPNAGKGEINASANADGFTLGGSFNFDTKTFDQAIVKIGYDSAKDKQGIDPWSASGTITISKKAKIKGVESASLTIGYDNGILTGDGHAVLNLPGVQEAGVNFKYGGGKFKITVNAKFDFKSKYIEIEKIEVILTTGGTGAEGQGGGNAGWSLGVSGRIKFNFPKLDKLGVDVSYEKGLFKAEGLMAFGAENKVISGKITAGVTNGVVANGTLQGGEGGKGLSFYGTSQIKFIPYTGIVTDLTVKLEPDGRILYSAKLDAHATPFPPIKPAPKNLFDYKQKIPLVGVPLLSLNFTFGAKADFYIEWLPLEIGATCRFDNKTIDDVLAGNFTAPFSVTLKTSGKVGIKVGINAGASATLALLEGGAELNGFLKLEAEAELSGKLDAVWQGEKGLKMKGGNGEAKAEINLIPGLEGRIYVNLNLLVSNINLWEHIKKFVEGEKHLLFAAGVTAPFEFDDNNSLKPFDPAKISFKPDLNDKTADTEAKKNTDVNNDNPKPLKADDALKNQIDAEVEANMRRKRSTQSLDMYQYAADLRQQMLERKDQKVMMFVNEAIEKALTKIEEEEFNNFRMEIMASKEPLAKKLAKVDHFQAFHKTVNSEWFKTMKDELRAQDAGNVASAGNKGPVQTKLLPGNSSPVTTSNQQGDFTGDANSLNKDRGLQRISTMAIIQRQPQPDSVPPVISTPEQAVTQIIQAIHNNDIGAAVRPLRNKSIGEISFIRTQVNAQGSGWLEHWLVSRMHRSSVVNTGLTAIGILGSIAVPGLTTVTTIGQTLGNKTPKDGTAEEGLRLLWPVLPLIDKLEIYDEGYRELEQAQLDVIKSSSTAQREVARMDSVVRLEIIFSEMDPKEEYDARVLIDTTPEGHYVAAVRLLVRAPGLKDKEDEVYDAILDLTPDNRVRFMNNHEAELYDMLYNWQLQIVRLMARGSEADALIARLRLATEGRIDDQAAIQAVVERAVALFRERKQIRASLANPNLPQKDRSDIEARLRQLDDLDKLLSVHRGSNGELDENSFMGLLSSARGAESFGADTQHLAEFSTDKWRYAFEAAKQRILIAGDDADAIRAALYAVHAPLPESSTPNPEPRVNAEAQHAADVKMREELKKDQQVRDVLSDLSRLDASLVDDAITGDQFSEMLFRLNQARNAPRWGEFFKLTFTIARNDEWRNRFEATSGDPFGVYARVYGDEREIMLKILKEKRLPFKEILGYTGDVDILREAFSFIGEDEREKFRLGWSLSHQPADASLTPDQQQARQAFMDLKGQVRDSQTTWGSFDPAGFENVMSTLLGSEPTASELSTGDGRYRAASLMYEQQEARLALGRGASAHFTETDETMVAAAREFAGLWLPLRSQKTLSMVDFAALSALNQRFHSRSEEFTEASNAISELASMIASTVAGIVVIAATGGAATPAVIALAAASGAGARIITREMFGEDYYNSLSSAGARDALLGAIDGALAIVSARLAARGAALIGMGSRSLTSGASKIAGSVTEEALAVIPRGTRVASSAVESALDGLLSGSVSEAFSTMTDDRTWRNGIMQGLVRVGQAALVGGLAGLATGGIADLGIQAVSAGTRKLWSAVAGQGLEKTLEKAGAGSLLAEARLAIRNGNVDQLNELVARMESRLAPEEATALRQQMHEELRDALGHPPGTARATDAESDLLAHSAHAESPTPEQVNAEQNIIKRSEPQPSRDPDYVDEIDLGNGHTWRRDEKGIWCRFSKPTLCAPINGAPPMSPKAVDRSKVLAAERQLNNLTKTIAHETKFIREYNDLIDRLAANARQGKAYNFKSLTEKEKELIGQAFPKSDIDNLTLQELQAARARRQGAKGEGPIPSPIERDLHNLFGQQEAAIEALRESKRPLYDKLRAASPTGRIRDRILGRAGKLDEVSGLLPTSGNLDIDHLVPLYDIAHMKGFTDLDWMDQVAIANFEPNLKAIDSIANSSRGSRSWASLDWSARRTYSPEALRRVVAEENSLRQRIQNEINKRLKK